MHCPFCKHVDTLVRDSRVVSGESSVKRKRLCPSCSGRFTTIERVLLPHVQVVKRSGAVKPFDRAKVFKSLCIATRKCGVGDDVLQVAVDFIVSEVGRVRGPVTTDFIGALAMTALRGINKVAYIRYASVYKNFQEIEDFNDFVNRERSCE